MSEPKQYADRDRRALGGHYYRHVSAMTGEELHAKTAIAAELAWRDAQIETVTRERDVAREALDVSEKSVGEYMAERNQARDLAHTMAGICASGCGDNKPRSSIEWAEHILAERDALRAEVERLTSAIRWACGYDEGPPDFEPPEDSDKRRYWWRNELMRRAALQEPTP